MGIKLDSKKRAYALGVLVIGAASTLGDLDHILPPYERSWGHMAVIPGVILLVLAVTHFGGWIKSWLLRRSK